jgi:hypothetical protein
MNRGEKNVLFILIVIIAQWFSPAVIGIRGIDIWIVPALLSSFYSSFPWMRERAR